MLRLSEYSILRVMRGADKLMKLRVDTIWEDAEGGGKLACLVAMIPHELKCLKKIEGEVITWQKQNTWILQPVLQPHVSKGQHHVTACWPIFFLQHKFLCWPGKRTHFLVNRVSRSIQVNPFHRWMTQKRAVARQQCVIQMMHTLHVPIRI